MWIPNISVSLPIAFIFFLFWLRCVV
jgi:hypothetical protein